MPVRQIDSAERLSVQLAGRPARHGHDEAEIEQELERGGGPVRLFGVSGEHGAQPTSCRVGSAAAAGVIASAPDPT